MSEQSPCLPGIFRQVVLQADKFHLTGKPTNVLRELVKVVKPGGTVLDPFMGSGTTAIAAIEAGLDFIGCEAEEAIFSIADQRIQDATASR